MTRKKILISGIAAVGTALFAVGAWGQDDATVEYTDFGLTKTPT